MSTASSLRRFSNSNSTVSNTINDPISAFLNQIGGEYTEYNTHVGQQTYSSQRQQLINSSMLLPPPPPPSPTTSISPSSNNNNSTKFALENSAVLLREVSDYERERVHRILLHIYARLMTLTNAREELFDLKPLTLIEYKYSDTQLKSLPNVCSPTRAWQLIVRTSAEANISFTQLSVLNTIKTANGINEIVHFQFVETDAVDTKSPPTPNQMIDISITIPMYLSPDMRTSSPSCHKIVHTNPMLLRNPKYIVQCIAQRREEEFNNIALGSNGTIPDALQARAIASGAVKVTTSAKSTNSSVDDNVTISSISPLTSRISPHVAHNNIHHGKKRSRSTTSAGKTRKLAEDDSGDDNDDVVVDNDDNDKNDKKPTKTKGGGIINYLFGSNNTSKNDDNDNGASSGGDD